MSAPAPVSAPELTLTVSHKAPNPRRVLMFLAEKGVYAPGDATAWDGRLALQDLDLFQGEQWSEAFRARSPLGQVPALTLPDGRTLTESRAICLYLEHVIAEPRLMGAPGAEAAFVEMWDRRMEYLILLTGAMAVRHSHPAFSVIEKQVPDYGAQSLTKLGEMAHWLDQELGTRAFVAGDTFTIADITAVVGLDFAKLAKMRTPAERFPHLARWREAVSARPSAKAGL